MSVARAAPSPQPLSPGGEGLCEGATCSPLPLGRGAGGEGPQPYRRVTPKHLLDRSRALRRDATDAERKLWARLRGTQLGVRWRRQVPIGPYIADFVCPAAQLIVELDGSQHADTELYDARRTAFLQREGYRVLRFWNSDALTNIEGVLDAICVALAAPSRQPLSPEGEGLSGPACSPFPLGRGVGGEGA